MQGTIGQNYAVNLFFGGISADISPELIDGKAGTVLDAHSFGISRVWKNVMRIISGDKYLAVASAPSTTITYIGGVWLNGYLVVFYRDTVADLTYIYANGVLIGQHADYPSGHCDIDTNDETSEMGITDNVTVPIVLNLNAMLAAQLVGELTYFANYDYKLYSVNKSLQLNQPVFVGLEDLGAGGGLKTGSYAYSVALASKSGETTPWGPITPYIPVPESGVSLIANAAEGFASGLKTWGGEPSLDGSRYGIRLKFRVANMSGFDYIKVKRIANCTGQPISYVPQSEFIILSTDAAGSVIDIKSDPYRVVEFVDSISKDWAVLDDSVTQMYSTVKRARTIRFYDRRIVLGGVEYESKILEDKNIFLQENNVNRIAFPVVKSLEAGAHVGFSDIYNQVYKKSHRLGERYGFATKLYDDQGNTLYTVPLKMSETKDDFTNFKFPNRRDKMPAGVKRVDTITLTGTSGSATVLCNGVSRTITFKTDLTQTAADFVTAYEADYYVSGVQLTCNLWSLVFRAIVAGVDFTGDTSITTDSDGDLAGTVITTQANVVPSRQEDLVLFAATPGYAFIGCTSSVGYMGRSITYSGSDARMAAVAYVSAYTADFATIGVTLSVYNNGGVKLTGPTSGTAISTIAEGTLILATNAVTTTVQPVATRPRIDRVLFYAYPSPIGTVDVTCNGVTRPFVGGPSWVTALDNFISSYGADYLPIVVSRDPSDLTGLRFTGTWDGVTTAVPRSGGNLSGSAANLQANVIGDPRIEVVVFKNVQGGECRISCTTDGSYHEVVGYGDTALDIMTYFLNEETISHGWADDGVTISYGGEGDGALRLTGPINKTMVVTAAGTAYDHITHIQDEAPPTAQIDKITLTGTSGNASITCGGLTRSFTYNTSILATALQFYLDYQAAYSAIGIDIVNDIDGIIFTALSAGTPFTSSIVNVPDNIEGIVGVMQTGATAIPQVDVVTFRGTSGTASITCQGVTRTASFSVALDVTAINFCVSNAAAYAAVGVTLSYSGDTVIFTGPANGTAIVTTATGTLVDNIYTTVPAALGVAQIDRATLTGTSGSVTITCNGISRSVAFISSLSDTASRFVLWHAAAYLPEIEVTSSGPYIYFRKLLALGVAFYGATTVTHDIGNLSGTIEHTIANGAGGGEFLVSTGVHEDATVLSWNAEDVGYVYDPVSARRLSKTDGSKELNIVNSGGKAYLPVTPTGRGSSSNQNNYEDITYMNIMNTVEGHSDDVGKYGRYVSTVGLRLGGIDVTKLPPSVKAFSVVRTPAAGRVVCQGIAMYALTEQAGNDPSLVKALNKVWFYSPEIDPVIGNKGGIYEDIKNNPGNYQMELVGPCGFFTDVYSSYNDGVNCLSQDMVSHTIYGAENYARGMFAPDHDQSIGRNNYITFGRWRNTSDQGTGIDASLTFSLTTAQDVPHARVRVPYLELTLGTNLYKYTEVKNEAGTTAQSKNFHEPWYIVNIIQNKQVPNNNVNSYNDIGHYIRLESTVGISNGEASQVFPLVDERREDVYGLGETAITYRYIWVDDKPWVDSNNIAGGNITTYLSTLAGAGKFTPTGGLECYGMYTLNTSNEITFNKVLSSGAAVVPEAGAKIVIKYNKNSPIEVFLGDTYVADATFLAIDGSAFRWFKVNAPMPHYNFELKTTYHQAYNPLDVNIWEDQGTHHIENVRQWLISFTCESTMNLPMAYKNFFPNRNYVMRPKDYGDLLTDETFAEFLTRLSIFSQYADDYPEESYESWSYGGLYTPSLVGFDYEKSIPLKSYAEPQSGSNELLSMMKRIHWTTQSIPGFDSNRVFVPTNIYDLKNDKASQISILYDQFSDRGNNLYVITDRGAGLLLTDKQMITTAEGNNLSILSSEASFIKGEVWLNSAIGCPKEFWRGKVEGNVKLPNNIVSEVLAFLGQDDIILFSNNNFIKLSDNYRRAIMTSLEAIDLTGDFVTKLYSAICDNKLQVNIGDILYSFNFDNNNWDGKVLQLNYDKILNAPYLSGFTQRNRAVSAFHNSTQVGLTVSQDSPDRVSAFATMPYITFSVTPEVGRDVDFVDMFLSCSYAPYSVQVSLDQDFLDSSTVLFADMKVIAGGTYHIQGFSRRSVSDRRLIGRTLFVKVTFPDNLQLYDLKMVRTGYKFVSGS